MAAEMGDSEVVGCSDRGRGGRGLVCEVGQSSSGGGRDVALPHPPRVFQLSGVEDDYPAPTSTGTTPIHDMSVWHVYVVLIVKWCVVRALGVAWLLLCL